MDGGVGSLDLISRPPLCSSDRRRGAWRDPPDPQFKATPWLGLAKARSSTRAGGHPLERAAPLIGPVSLVPCLSLPPRCLARVQSLQRAWYIPARAPWAGRVQHHGHGRQVPNPVAATHWPAPVRRGAAAAGTGEAANLRGVRLLFGVGSPAPHTSRLPVAGLLFDS